MNDLKEAKKKGLEEIADEERKLLEDTPYRCLAEVKLAVTRIEEGVELMTGVDFSRCYRDYRVHEVPLHTTYSDSDYFKKLFEEYNDLSDLSFQLQLLQKRRSFIEDKSTYLNLSYQSLCVISVAELIIIFSLLGVLI